MHKTLFLFILLVFFSYLGYGQKKDTTLGNWVGAIELNMHELKIAFKINNGTCLLDVPIQGVNDYPASSCEIVDDSMNIVFSGRLEAMFSGVIQRDSMIVGKWIQGGINYPTQLRREKKFLRPQNPQPPFPYNIENITYFNQDSSIQFGGTLTIPQEGTKHAVAILITGSGQQDRDETLFGHKPFLVIADYLTRHGIAVLRIDDRGIGQTTGKETLANATSYDFAKDVTAAIEYLKNKENINPKQIGLIGHSEGGIIASIVGAMRNDVAFIVSLAGVGVTGGRHASSQSKKALEPFYVSPYLDSIMVLSKEVVRIILREKSDRLAEVALATQFYGKRMLNQDTIVQRYFGFEKKMEDGFIKTKFSSGMDRYKIFMMPWYRYFLSYNPEPFLSKIKVPFLALNGDMDSQVEADLNLKGFKHIFDKYGKRNYKIIRYPGLNHFFQHCKTCGYDEIESIEETISPEVLNDISVWINEQLGKQ